MATNGILDQLTTTARPLKIIIAGAGIGGLCAALGLRQQGHDVAIYEQSRMAQEAGAAIHLAPNCNGLLKRLGMEAQDHGSVELKGLTMYSPSCVLQHSMDTRPINRMWQHRWDLIHRAHLHKALLDLAMSPDVKGKPIDLHLSSGVESVDPVSASVTLADGSVVAGDLVIGADGVHSKTRKTIPGGDLKPFDSGKTAYRFLIPTDLIAATPVTQPLLQHENHLIMWIAEDRRVVMYPCVGGTQMNFVAMYPSKESSNETDGDSWHSTGSKSRMLKLFSGFGEQVLGLLNLVDESKLKTWTLLDMDKMPSFIHEKFAAIGDAAHPFLPHQAQGGAQAIEDGISIAAVLPLGTKRDEVSERLHVYQSQRYDRSHYVQQFTRLSGADLAKGQQLDVQAFTVYNVAHDEWHSSTAALQKHLAKKHPNTRWRIPVSFGPAPGPRQPLGFALTDEEVHLIRARTPETSSTYSIRFRSSRTYLQNLLPPGFAFVSPATVCEATLVCNSLHGMTWLGGGGYNFVMLEIHGVQYIRRDGERLVGRYLPIIFENLADPIVTGRDDLGMPKLFSDIKITEQGGDVTVEISWRGAIFGKMSFGGFHEEPTETGTVDRNETQQTPAPGPPAPKETGQFAWRYVPAVGQPDKADAEYPVFLPKPDSANATKGTTVRSAQNASFEFVARDWVSLPTLHNVARVLADIPNYGVIESKHVTAIGVDDLSGAYRIE